MPQFPATLPPVLFLLIPDDHDCDMRAVCAFAALIPLTSAQHDLSVSVIRDAVPTMGFLFASYRSIADTPPPRTSL